LCPYTTLFRSVLLIHLDELVGAPQETVGREEQVDERRDAARRRGGGLAPDVLVQAVRRVVQVHVGVDEPGDEMPAATVDGLLRHRELVGTLGKRRDL